MNITFQRKKLLHEIIEAMKMISTSVDGISGKLAATSDDQLKQLLRRLRAELTPHRRMLLDNEMKSWFDQYILEHPLA
jgi:rubrerythrin